MFSKDLALKCLDLSIVTGMTMPNAQAVGTKIYGEDNVKRLMAQYSSKNVVFFEDVPTDTHGLFYIENGTLFIGFRGSESLENWEYDFMIDKKKVPFDRDPSMYKDRLHDGFLKAYMAVRSIVFQQVMNSGFKKIIVTGHSLGAAIATICVLDVQYNFRDCDVKLYCSGVPRVGNKQYIKGFNKYVKEAYCIRQGRDLISYLPPNLLGFFQVRKYMHVGPHKLFPSLKDHYPLRYWTAMNKDLK
jgi:predicted lipase